MHRRSVFGVWLGMLMWVAGLAAADSGISLVEAVRTGNRDAVRTLLKQRADVNALAADGMTALHWAVRADDAETASLLIRAGANVKAANRYGVTPIMLAATNANAATIEMLLKAGADANSSLPEGQTALMSAARSGGPEAIKVLVAHGANVNAKEPSLGETALMWAASENHAAAARALVAGGADIDARSNPSKLPEFKWAGSFMVPQVLPRGAWTPMMYAARQGATEAARALADAGADLNLTDPDGTTALVLAIINAHFDLANILLEKGADPNIADRVGMGALYAAVDMHTRGATLGRPAPKFIDNLDAVDLVRSLLARGADPNATLKRPLLMNQHDSGDASMGEGTTPLMRAAKTVDVSVMRLLLDGGADPMLTQKNHTTVLMIAAAGNARADPLDELSDMTGQGAVEAVKLCLQKGVDINAFNDNRQTAVHTAVARGADDVLRFLAEQGARLDLKDNQGRTPLDLALGVGGGRGGRGGTPKESTAACFVD